MQLARVVSFDGVSEERINQQVELMKERGRPEELPATEIVVLHDAEAEEAQVVIFFDSEEDYRRGDEVLNAMAADETPGRRTGVAKCRVAIRMTG
jgi:hypothetical protein